MHQECRIQNREATGPIYCVLELMLIKGYQVCAPCSERAHLEQSQQASSHQPQREGRVTMTEQVKEEKPSPRDESKGDALCTKGYGLDTAI